MAKRGNPEVLRLIVLFLRFYADLSQSELARRVGLGQGDISRYEAGGTAPPQEVLRRMADAVGVPWSTVVHLRRCIEAVLSSAARRDESEDEAGGGEDLEISILEPVLLSVLPALIEAEEGEEIRTPDEEVWTALQDLPAGYRQRLRELGGLVETPDKASPKR
jgi:transcriptional regulator with XRE-family HTH domain